MGRSHSFDFRVLRSAGPADCQPVIISFVFLFVLSFVFLFVLSFVFFLSSLDRIETAIKRSTPPEFSEVKACMHMQFLNVVVGVDGVALWWLRCGVWVMGVV